MALTAPAPAAPASVATALAAPGTSFDLPLLPTGPATMPLIPVLPGADGGLLLIGLLGLAAIALRGRRLGHDPKLAAAPLDESSGLLDFR